MLCIDDRSDSMSEAMKRVNIRVSNEVDAWFADRSSKTGVSKSALMFLALEAYMQQQSLTETLPALISRIDKLEELRG